MNCCLSKLNPEQRHVYNGLLSSVESNKGGFFFVYRIGGCGQTYLQNALITKLLRVKDCFTSDLIWDSSNTVTWQTHLYPDSTCSITHNSDIRELLKQTQLIIWDEAPMQHRYTFEALDRSLRDIMIVFNPDKLHQPFGGITMLLLGGDIRQTPHVVNGQGSDTNI